MMTKTHTALARNVLNTRMLLIKCLLGVVTLGVLRAETVQAQQKNIFRNTPFDPGTWVPKPSNPGGSTSPLAVQTPGIDENGYVYEDSPYGNRTYSGRRGQLKRDSQTGRAIWEEGTGNSSLRSWAAAKWQQQLNEQDRTRQQQQLAVANREAEKRAAQLRNDEIRRQQEAQQQLQSQQFAYQQWQHTQQQLQAQQFAHQQWLQAEAARRADWERQMQMQQQMTQKPPVQNDAYSPKLGIFYQQVAYNNGTFGARLIRHPEQGSPMSALQLEPGDTIWALDGQRLATLAELENHHSETRVDFVNVRTNATQTGTVFINQ